MASEGCGFMSDFARTASDRAALREHDTPFVRARSQKILDRVDRELRERGIRDNEIESLAAIGAACPFTLQWEKDIWLEEVRARFYAERSSVNA